MFIGSDGKPLDLDDLSHEQKDEIIRQLLDAGADPEVLCDAQLETEPTHEREPSLFSFLFLN